ncbi:hypothetical protein KKG63_03540 [Patescibacteria group bacterium]|nr:hypothetical protein [Patescibacteria group bacterium]MBU1999456.1 hypothetical protein [Candidatus Omnitrophota bacterium]
MAIGASKLGQMALAKETVWGTAPTFPNPAPGLVITSEDFSPDVGIEVFQEISGSMQDRRTGRGVEQWKGTIEFPLEIGGQGVGGVGELLSSVFGTDTVSGIADPYLHTLTVLEATEISSYSLWFDRDVGYYQLQGFRPSSVSISVDRGSSSIPVSINGIAQQEVSSTTKVVGYSTELPMTPQMAGVTVDGVTVDGWEKVDVEFSRELEAINALTGNDYIGLLLSKTFTAKLSASGVFGTTKLDDVVRSAYRNRTPMAIVITIQISANRSIVMTFPKVQLDSFKGPKLSGSDIVRADFTGIILKPDTGNNKVEIKNSRVSSYTA